MIAGGVWSCLVRTGTGSGEENIEILFVTGSGSVTACDEGLLLLTSGTGNDCFIIAGSGDGEPLLSFSLWAW